MRVGCSRSSDNESSELKLSECMLSAGNVSENEKSTK